MRPPQLTAQRKRIYGITQEQFEELWEEQDGRCLICERKFTRLRPAHIDHEHATGKVRGLLCGNCNQSIGWLHEDAGWLRRAAHYLTHPPAFVLWGEEVPTVQGAPPASQGE